MIERAVNQTMMVVESSIKGVALTTAFMIVGGLVTGTVSHAHELLDVAFNPISHFSDFRESIITASEKGAAAGAVAAVIVGFGLQLIYSENTRRAIVGGVMCSSAIIGGFAAYGDYPKHAAAIDDVAINMNAPTRTIADAAAGQKKLAQTAANAHLAHLALN